MNKDIPLGSAPPTFVKSGCTALNPDKMSDKDRINLLEQQVTHMSKVIVEIKKEIEKGTKPTRAVPDHGLNKDGIPVGTVCIGTTEKHPFPVYLTVEENGYRVGVHVYESVSAAAMAISGVRRSGWVFWKLADGRTLKEAYKD